MGSYASCYLGQLLVGSSKNWVDGSLLQHFRPSDAVITTKFEDLPQILREQWSDSVEPPSEEYPFYYYRTTASAARERLDAMGYTIEAASAAFTECVRREIEVLREREKEHPELYADEVYARTHLTAARWQEILQKVISGELKYHLGEGTFGKPRDVLLGVLLSEKSWYGYPGLDTSVPLRIALENCHPSEELLYDLTDLLWSDAISLDNDDFEGFSWELRSRSATTIVLTEGRFDAFVLSESLKLLHPRITDLLSFMDFETYDPDGGAAALVKQVRAFAGAGVLNRVIALFDNDSASLDAIRALRTTPLPNRIKIVTLPDAEFLRRYPTLGPAGNSEADINGVAASIELYLGTDVLTDPDSGELTRVQWKGYVAGVKKYYGEILDKGAIQARFKERLARCKAGKEALMAGDWSGLELIFKKIFSAFDVENSAELLDDIKVQYEKGFSRD